MTITHYATLHCILTLAASQHIYIMV